MLYRTDDATRWGTGKGANLTPVEIDGNFWDLAERLVAVEGGGVAANGIANITVTGSQMTVYLEDGTALGPYTLPTAMIRYRGDRVAGAAYAELDLVAVPGSGIYLVLHDHVSAAAFDANAQDAEGNTLYRFLFPMAAAGAAGTLGTLDDVDLATAAPADGDVLGYDAVAALWTPRAPGAAGAGALDELADVAISTPAAGHLLRYDGASWINGSVDWAEVTGRPATFPPAAHGHDWSEITGRPATIDALPAAVGAAGTVLKAGAGGTIVWGTDETGAGGGATTFLGLADTPAAFGTPGQAVVINATGDALEFADPAAGGGASTLDELTDVAIAAPAGGHFLGHDGAGWVNAEVDWSDLTGKPATFPASAHQHTAAEISDFAEALDDRVAALLVAGANIALTYDDATGALTIAATGGGAGGGGGGAFAGFYADRSGGATQALAANTVTTKTYDTEVYDTEGAFNPATGLFTVPAALDGQKMMFVAGTRISSNATSWATYIKKNGNTIAQMDGSSTATMVFCSAPISVATGDVIQVDVFSNAAKDLQGNGANCFAGYAVDAGGGAATFLDLTDTPAAFGTAGQIPVVNATTDGLEFVDPPSSTLVGFRVTRTAGTQAVAAATVVDVTYDTEVFDTDALIVPATGTFTVPASLNGKWMEFTAGMRLANTATAQTISVVRDGTFLVASTTAGGNASAATGPLQVATGQVFKVTVFSASATNVAADERNFFAGRVLG